MAWHQIVVWQNCPNLRYVTPHLTKNLTLYETMSYYTFPLEISCRRNNRLSLVHVCLELIPKENPQSILRQDNNCVNFLLQMKALQPLP